MFPLLSMNRSYLPLFMLRRDRLTANYEPTNFAHTVQIQNLCPYERHRYTSSLTIVTAARV